MGAVRGVYASDILAMQARFDKRTLPYDIALSVERFHCIQRLAQQWRLHKSLDTSNTTLFSRNYSNARNMLTILLVHGDRLNTVRQKILCSCYSIGRYLFILSFFSPLELTHETHPKRTFVNTTIQLLHIYQTNLECV